ASRQQPGQLRRAGSGEVGPEALGGRHPPAQSTGPSPGGLPEAGRHLDKQSWAGGPPGAGAGQQVSPGAPLYRAWQQTYGKSVQLCAPGLFVARLSCLADSAGGTIVLINPWRARLSQTCPCGRMKKITRSERWHACPCGASAQRDLPSAFLAASSTQ